METIKDTDTQHSCPLVLTVNGAVVESFSHKVDYQAAKSPILQSIEPRYGSVLGGTDITFSGTGFKGFADPSLYKITVDGVDCPIKGTVTDTEIICTSGPRPGTPEQSLEIYIDGVGLVATQGLRFTYARYWSNEATWGGLFAPLEGESVHIQKGVNLIMDIPRPPNLQIVIVEGSLIFLPDADANHHRYFDARYIYVRQGRMEVGTEDHPYTSRITITLHGNIKDPYLPIYGNKVLAVERGSLDLHGVPRAPTWT